MEEVFVEFPQDLCNPNARPGQEALRGAGNLRATCGSANFLDGAPPPAVLEIEPKGVEFFPFEGLLVYRGEFSPTFPVGLVEPSHFGQPPSLTACRSMVPSRTRR